MTKPKVDLALVREEIRHAIEREDQLRPKDMNSVGWGMSVGATEAYERVLRWLNGDFDE